MCSLAMLTGSCTDILDEQPRSNFTPDFFQTAQGIEYGLTAAYSALRYQYGPEGAMSLTVVGTDESTYGGDGGAKDLNDYGSAVNNNGHLQTPWNRNYTYINTCNGICEFGPTTGRDDLVAEARFLRAQYYFNLVSTFGGVPLDLGSGKLKFNSSAVTTSVRNSAIEVYEAMLSDFIAASEDLPDKPAIGHVGKAAALHFVAKTYLAMGCYYEYDYTNELNGATNIGKAKECYGMALTYAQRLIDNQGQYGASLCGSFAEVNKDQNEHNSEVLFLVEHCNDYTFDESAAGSGGVDAGLKENRSNFMMCPYYEAHGNYTNGGNPFVRSTEYGRGWRRFIPTKWLLESAFADKINDSRYYATFQSEWFANKTEEQLGSVKNENGEVVKPGELAMYMPGYDIKDANMPAVIKSKIETATAAGARIWSPGEYTPNMFPSNLKYNAPSRNAVNDASNRPFLVAKLSETYLIAAEAALKSDADPTGFVNVLRERAAMGSLIAETEGLDKAISAMRVTRGDIDLDFILDEKSRELCTEQHRWFDLVRTNKLYERITSGKNSWGYAGRSDSENSKAADNLRAANNMGRHFNLRPIPQSQIDAMTGANKESYQNPGY